MKPEEVKIGETYWLRVPNRNPVFSYHGRFLVTSKAPNLAVGKCLDGANSFGSEYFYWRLLRLEDHRTLVAMGNILVEIDLKFLSFAKQGIDTSLLQKKCSELKSLIAKELEGAQ